MANTDKIEEEEPTFSPQNFSDSSLDWQKCVYRGEGNANLVVALPLERKVIRFRKFPKCMGESKQLTTVNKQKEVQEKSFAHREANFIRKVISGFLGRYVYVPEIVHCDDLGFVRLADTIRSNRPESRRDKEFVPGYATKYPDYTFLPTHLSNYSDAPTYCVEIKPKQGFLCKADKLFKKCPYCMMQYYKVQKGSIKKASSYCPFDFFSGDAKRMDRALSSLLDSPQNNFRIFKNGTIIYDDTKADFNSWKTIFCEWFATNDLESQIRLFLKLVRTALTQPLDSDNNSRIQKQLQSREVNDFLLTDNVPKTRLKPDRVQQVNSLLLNASVKSIMQIHELMSIQAVQITRLKTIMDDYNNIRYAVLLCSYPLIVFIMVIYFVYMLYISKEASIFSPKSWQQLESQLTDEQIRQTGVVLYYTRRMCFYILSLYLGLTFLQCEIEREEQPLALSKQQSVDSLPQGSVLERILQMQQLHRCGDDVIVWLAAQFSSQIDDQLIYENLIDTSFLISTQLVETKVNDRNGSAVLNNLATPSYLKKKVTECKKEVDCNLQNLTMTDCLRLLENYLLSCTAKDCSILMSFQEIKGESLNKVDVTEVVKLPNRQCYLIAVRVIDVDMKSLEVIRKHYQRDNDVLEACIEDIKKNQNCTTNR